MEVLNKSERIAVCGESFFGAIDELVTSSACHAEGRGFESR